MKSPGQAFFYGVLTVSVVLTITLLVIIVGALMQWIPVSGFLITQYRVWILVAALFLIFLDVLAIRYSRK